MKVCVTGLDIAQGTPGSASHCPIALAVGRALGTWILSVNRRTIRWTTKGMGFAVNTPSEVADFIGAFDDNLPVKPFEFELKEAYFTEPQCA